MPDSEIPISTRWLLDAVGDTGRSAINSVYMIMCPVTNGKGSGFLLNSGHIITNWHVINGSPVNTIRARSSTGETITFSNAIVDQNRDLAALEPSQPLDEGLNISSEEHLRVGTKVSTWGFPLGYNGPAPLLTIGYLSGFNQIQSGTSSIKHLVVNGAFNPGNSGGPLFIANQNEVVGVVVSKHSPIPPGLLSVLRVFENTRSGLQYSGTNSRGAAVQYSEAQLVAALLNHFRSLLQVVIGEAIDRSELLAFLTENEIVEEV